VDGARDQLLARPGLAGDEDGRARGRNLIDELEDGLHLLGATDDRAALDAPDHRTAERLPLLLLAPTLDAGGDRRRHLLVLKGLADAVERAALPRADRRVVGRVGRNHDDDGFGVALQEFFERAQAPHARHRNVEQHDIVSPPPVGFEALFAGARQINPVPFGREQRLQDIAHDFLVVDDEH
jgi:hypothetical protein